MKEQVMTHIGDLDVFHPDQIDITRELTPQRMDMLGAYFSRIACDIQLALRMAGPLPLWQRTAYELKRLAEIELDEKKKVSLDGMADVIFMYVQFLQNCSRYGESKLQGVEEGHPLWKVAEEVRRIRDQQE